MFFLRFSECHVTFLQAVSFPAVQSLWGRWAPPLERSKLVSFTYLGTLVINPHYRLTPFPTFWSKYVFFFVHILAQYLGFVFLLFLQEPCLEWWERFLRQVSCVSTGLTTDGDPYSTSLVILFDHYLFLFSSSFIFTSKKL